MEFVTSQQGIDRIKKFESCRLTAYQDAEEYGRLAMDIRAVYMRGCRYRRNRQRIY